MTVIEILATSVDGVRAAIAGGASRIELCQDLAAGGTTPSAGLIKEACRIAMEAGVPVMVMIRPRGGDFVYDPAEISVMRTDIATARESGAAGVVFGCLDSQGRVDSDLTRLLLDDANELEVTFHRAVDVTINPEEAARDAFVIGCDRVLTSGGAASAWDGRSTIKNIVRAAPDHCQVVAAGGIVPSNVRQVVAATGVTEVHASVRTVAEDRAAMRLDVGMVPDWPAGSWPVPDVEKVRQLRDSLRT
jgi:copper homeostasis protein